MGHILSQLGHLFVQAIPTAVLVFILMFVLDRLFFRRLMEVLNEREARTIGALARAREQATLAETRSREYEAAFQAVRPNRPFDPAHGGWGAFELAARLHRLSVDPDAFAAGFADASRSARRATAWAVGINWHLSRNVKYVLDYEQTSFRGGAVAGDRPTERAVLLRAQVAF